MLYIRAQNLSTIYPQTTSTATFLNTPTTSQSSACQVTYSDFLTSAPSHSFDLGKNPERVAAGLKAASHNPTLSENKREDARRRLQEMGVHSDTNLSSRQAGSGVTDQDEVDSGARFDNSTEDSDMGISGDQHQHHVLGGYKATLKSTFIALVNGSGTDLCSSHRSQCF